MRKRIGRVSDIVRQWFAGRIDSAKAPPPSVRLTLEALEHRLVLSASVPTLPHLNGINLSVPGDAFVLAGTATPTAFDPMTKWSQPGGLGSPITITYSYSNLLDGRIGLDAGTVKATIQEALSRWAAVAPLRFVEVPDSGPAPSTAEYNQGSGAMIRFGHLSIDGPGKILAYGYYPGPTGLAGDILFDDTEKWSTNPNAGDDLLEIAEHEIGHALGLAHEPPASAGGTNAIMNPYYGSRFHGLGTSYLFGDDISGIRAIYGAGVGGVIPYNPTPLTPASIPLTPARQRFVQALYLAELGRAGSAAELDGYNAMLNEPDGTTAVARSIQRSTEGRDHLVKSWYLTFLGRAANGTEEMGHVNALLQGRTEEDVLGGILGGTEFFNRAQSPFASGTANEQFVQSLYVVLLNRTAGASEVAGQVNAIASAGLQGVARSFLSSSEYRSDQFEGYYNTLLHRPSDVQGLNGWVSSTTDVSNVRLSFEAGAEFFLSTPSISLLNGNSITATNFHADYASASGGGSIASLGGSAGDDTAYATRTSTRL